jgi:SAM-dependent MidA family methyltransferase
VVGHPSDQGQGGGRPAGGSLASLIARAIDEAGGWLPFDRFMALALYAPGMGYYSRGEPLFGAWPASGSDFVTAPELSPLFGQTLARPVAQALRAAGATTVWEFGAGSGALAEQVLQALDTGADPWATGRGPVQWRIVELSGALHARQRQRLARFGERVQWLQEWPAAIEGVVLGNEVLDAMPVQLLHWDGRAWRERGVAVDASRGGHFAWADRPTALRPPVADPDHHFAPGSVVEIAPQAEAFVRSLAQRLVRGAAFFLDYGFPEHELYHPQRHAGTLMCHRAHRADADPLADVGEKDITAHVNFSAVALAAQDAGLDVLGYTSQAHFLLNCGLLDLPGAADPRERGAVQMLLHEHEMGELFKVLGLARGVSLDALGFTRGDRSHTL